jgi:hypothetical protein
MSLKGAYVFSESFGLLRIWFKVDAWTPHVSFAKSREEFHTPQLE